jgi:TolB-like protein
MKTALFAVALLLTGVLARSQDIDAALTTLTEKLAIPVSEHKAKKITVLDFTDLGGDENGLGKYIAEQMTVEFVLKKRDFAVLDRANLNKILAEHKLTAKGLIDPDNAKKLGQFAGVDALIIGTLLPKGQNMGLIAKIITTDTAEVVGAARGEFKQDETTKELMAKQTTEAKSSGSLADDGVKVSKTFGDLRVGFQTLRIVNRKEYVLTLILANQNKKESIAAGINTDVSYLKGSLTNPEENEFQASRWEAAGINVVDLSRTDTPLSVLKPGESSSVTVKYYSSSFPPKPGLCRINLQFLAGSIHKGKPEIPKVYNMIQKLETE